MFHPLTRRQPGEARLGAADLILPAFEACKRIRSTLRGAAARILPALTAAAILALPGTAALILALAAPASAQSRADCSGIWTPPPDGRDSTAVVTGIVRIFQCGDCCGDYVIADGSVSGQPVWSCCSVGGPSGWAQLTGQTVRTTLRLGWERNCGLADNGGDVWCAQDVTPITPVRPLCWGRIKSTYR